MVKIVKKIIEYSCSMIMIIGALAFFYLAATMDRMFLLPGIVFLVIGIVILAEKREALKNNLYKIDVKDGCLLIVYSNNGNKQKLNIKLDDIKNIKYEHIEGKGFRINIECNDDNVHDILVRGILRKYLYSDWKISNVVSIVQRHINKQPYDDLVKTEKCVNSFDLIIILIVIIAPIILIFLASR